MSKIVERIAAPDGASFSNGKCEMDGTIRGVGVLDFVCLLAWELHQGVEVLCLPLKKWKEGPASIIVWRPNITLFPGFPQSC